MRRTSKGVLSGVALVIGLLGASAGQAPKTTGHLKYDTFAQKVVHDSAGVNEGDFVLITGSSRDGELLENIATEVRRVGAFPLVQLISERMSLLYFSKVPEKYDAQEPLLDLELVKVFNVNINVDPSEHAGAFRGVPVGRKVALSRVLMAVAAARLKRGPREVNVGNNLYPTEDRARLFGVSKQELTNSFWNGINVDYARLRATARAGMATLAGGKEVHISNPNGTDLKVHIEGRTPLASDGIVSDECTKKRGAACQVWLPAGEVFTSVIPGTAQGKVVVDRQLFEGKEIRRLTLMYSMGKLVSMTAPSGAEQLKARYDAASPGKESFGVIDIGINPKIHYGPRKQLMSWVVSGMVTVTMGYDLWAGGENDTSFALNSFLPGSTLKVDGKVLVEKGILTF